MSNTLVQVATFQFAPEAELARLRLEQEGITAILADAETVSMDWMLGNAVGYIKLRVPEAQSERARQILEGARVRTWEAPSDPRVRCRSCGEILARTVTTCPMCGSEIQIGSDEDDDSADEPTGLMDSFRSGKQLVVLLMLSPCLAGAAISILLLGFDAIQHLPQFLGGVLLLVGCGALCLVVYRGLMNWLVK